MSAKPCGYGGTAHDVARTDAYTVAPPVQTLVGDATWPPIGATFDVPLAAAVRGLVEPLWMQPKRSASAPKSKPVRYPLFTEGRTAAGTRVVSLPRAYGLACFPGTRPEWYAALCIRMESCDRLREFNGTLLPHQPAAVQHVLGALRESTTHGGLLEAACGAGKTTMSLYIASVLAVPTMVVVHTGKLLDQWVERVKQYLPHARLGVLQGQNRPGPDCDVCIGMLQTVMNLDASASSAVQRYGLLVVDECHHICASSFSRAVTKFLAPYRLGLTATAQRGDGTAHAIEWVIGPKLYSIVRTSARVGVLAVAYDNPEFEHATRKWDKTAMDWVATVTRVVNDPWRTRRIAELLYELATKEGRRVVAISSRVSLLEDLHALLPGSGLIAGKNKNGKDEQILLASQGLVAEGVDDPRLDTLVLLTPVKVTKEDARLLTQAVGRVEERGNVRKTRPSLVVDFYDKYQMFTGMFRARRKWYADHGFTFRKPRTVSRPIVRPPLLHHPATTYLAETATLAATTQPDSSAAAYNESAGAGGGESASVPLPAGGDGGTQYLDVSRPLPLTVPDAAALRTLLENVVHAPFTPLPGWTAAQPDASKGKGRGKGKGEGKGESGAQGAQTARSKRNAATAAAHVSAGEVSAGEVSAGKVSAGEVGAGEVGAGEVGAGNTAPPKKTRTNRRKPAGAGAADGGIQPPKKPRTYKRKSEDQGA